MDEITFYTEFKTATKEANEGDVRRALTIVLQLIGDLNARVIELQNYEPDEDE
jgi:hypothetical protein